MEHRSIGRRVSLSFRGRLSMSLRYLFKRVTSIRRCVVINKVRRFHEFLFSLLRKFTANKLRDCVLKLRDSVAVPRRYILRVAGRLYIVSTRAGNSITQNVVTEAAQYRTRILRGFYRRLASLSRSAIPNKSKGINKPKCKDINKLNSQVIKAPKGSSKVINKPKILNKPKNKVINKSKGMNKPIGSIKQNKLDTNQLLTYTRRLRPYRKLGRSCVSMLRRYKQRVKRRFIRRRRRVVAKNKKDHQPASYKAASLLSSLGCFETDISGVALQEQYSTGLLDQLRKYSSQFELSLMAHHLWRYHTEIVRKERAALSPSTFSNRACSRLARRLRSAAEDALRKASSVESESSNEATNRAEYAKQVAAYASKIAARYKSVYTKTGTVINAKAAYASKAAARYKSVYTKTGTVMKAKAVLRYRPRFLPGCCMHASNVNVRETMAVKKADPAAEAAKAAKAAKAAEAASAAKAAKAAEAAQKKLLKLAIAMVPNYKYRKAASLAEIRKIKLTDSIYPVTVPKHMQIPNFDNPADVKMFFKDVQMKNDLAFRNVGHQLHQHWINSVGVINYTKGRLAR